MQRAPSSARRGYTPGGGPQAAAREVPFDYVAEFPITGNPGQTREAVINISPDGPFTAVAISYGFEQQRGVRLGALTSLTGDTAPGQLTLRNFPLESLLDGFRVNPRFLPVVFEVRNTDAGLIPERYSTVKLSPLQLNNTQIFERIQPVSPIDFFLSVIDTASGRELQDQPSFSLATLGESGGRRPFRALPVPVLLGARTSLRFQIIERTPNVAGTLFINLIGYHEFTGGCAAPADPGRTFLPNGRTIPFDYVTRVRLTGQADRRAEDEIVVDGNFVAHSISYGLQTDGTDVAVTVPGTPTFVNLAAVQLDQLPVRALVEGFRVRPNLVRLAFNPGGDLASIKPELVNRVFETLNQPESVSFRYSLFDGGIGRDLQNQAVHNIAGLGSALGERPFKQFAKPLHIEPSSKFKISVVEGFGRGDLYVVLQGHRVAGGRG